jgi:hypothetical protein
MPCSCCCLERMLLRFFFKNLNSRPEARLGPPAPALGFGSVCRSGLLIFLYSLLTSPHLPRRCRGVPPGRGGAAGQRRCGTRKLQKRCLRGLTTCVHVCVRSGFTALRNVVADDVPNACRPRSLSRRLWRSAAHANGAVRNGSTNVRLASRDTRGGLRACCSRAARRRGERPVSATG